VSVQQPRPSRVVEVVLVAVSGCAAFVAVRALRTGGSSVQDSSVADRGLAPGPPVGRPGHRSSPVSLAFPSVRASAPFGAGPRLPVAEFSGIDRLMLDDPQRAGATRRAAFAVFLDLVKAGRGCVPREMPYSLLQYEYEVESESNEVVVSGVRIRVIEGAPLPDSVSSCLSRSVEGTHRRAADRTGEFLGGQRFEMRSPVPVASPPRQD
jgi:hypothetical protein